MEENNKPIKVVIIAVIIILVLGGILWWWLSQRQADVNSGGVTNETQSAPVPEAVNEGIPIPPLPPVEE